MAALQACLCGGGRVEVAALMAKSVGPSGGAGMVRVAVLT